MTVHEIRRGAPPLTDIAGQLRALADLVERGDVKPDTVICVLRTTYPGHGVGLSVRGWGTAAFPHEFDGILLNAAIGRGICDSDENDVSPDAPAA